MLAIFFASVAHIWKLQVRCQVPGELFATNLVSIADRHHEGVTRKLIAKS